MVLGAYLGIAVIAALIVFVAGRRSRESGVSPACRACAALLAGTAWPLLILGVAELVLAYGLGAVSRRI